MLYEIVTMLLASVSSVLITLLDCTARNVHQVIEKTNKQNHLHIFQKYKTK